MTPKEFFRIRQEERGRDDGPEVRRPAGHVAALLVPGRRPGRGARSRTVWASTARPSAAGRASTCRTCWRCRTRARPCMDPFFAKPTVSVIANIVDPITREEYSRDPRYVARKAEAYLKKTGHRRHVPTSGRSRSSSSSTRSATSRTSTPGMYEIDSVEGAWNTARFEEPNLGYKPQLQGRLLPGQPDRHLPRPPRRDGRRDAEGRHRRRGAPPRGGHRRPERDRHAVRRPAQDGRPDDVVQVHQSRTWPSGTARR